jgi:hypothetical protein
LHGVDQAFLQRSVVVEEQRGGDARGQRDVARGGAVEPVLDDGVAGGLADPLLAGRGRGGLDCESADAVVSY